jgi:hypothetical protein
MLRQAYLAGLQYKTTEEVIEDLKDQCNTNSLNNSSAVYLEDNLNNRYKILKIIQAKIYFQIPTITLK